MCVPRRFSSAIHAQMKHEPCLHPQTNQTGSFNLNIWLTSVLLVNCSVAAGTKSHTNVLPTKYSVVIFLNACSSMILGISLSQF